MRAISSSSRPIQLLGACLFCAAVLVVFLVSSDWGQAWLALLCIAAGLISGRWWSVTLAASVMPIAAVLYAVDPGSSDSVSDPLSAALFAGLFVLPMALVIAVGVAIHRLLLRARPGR